VAGIGPNVYPTGHPLNPNFQFAEEHPRDEETGQFVEVVPAEDGFVAGRNEPDPEPEGPEQITDLPPEDAPAKKPSSKSTKDEASSGK
jgi:hypothetical protein